MTDEIDRLVCAVVHNDDANRVNQALVDGGYGVTRITAQGGFLRRGNAVFVIGVAQSAVDAVIDLLKRTAHQAGGAGRRRLGLRHRVRGAGRPVREALTWP